MLLASFLPVVAAEVAPSIQRRWAATRLAERERPSVCPQGLYIYEVPWYIYYWLYFLRPVCHGIGIDTNTRDRACRREACIPRKAAFALPSHSLMALGAVPPAASRFVRREVAFALPSHGPGRRAAGRVCSSDASNGWSPVISDAVSSFTAQILALEKVWSKPVLE